MASEAEGSRIAVQASQSVQQHRLAVARQEAQDAAVDVEVLRNASSHLGTQKVLQSLLLGAQAEERRQRQRVALAQAPERGNTSLLEKQYHEKREAISQVLQQRSTATRSLEVLTAALEDESGYLADLQMTCELAKVAYRRLEGGNHPANNQNELDSQAAPDQAAQASPATAKVELPTKVAKTEEQPARVAKAVQQHTTAVKAVVHHRRKPALRSGAKLAQQAEKHVVPVPRVGAKLRAAAKAAAKSHPVSATVASASVHKEPVHKEPTVAPAGIRKETVSKVASAAKESTAASAGVHKVSSAASTAKSSPAAVPAAVAAKETSAAPAVAGEASTAASTAKTSAAASAGAGEGSPATAAKTSTADSSAVTAGAGEDSNEASAGDSEETAAAAPAGDSKGSTAASVSENEEPTAASSGIRKEPAAAPVGAHKDAVVVTAAGPHKERKKPKAATSVGEVFDGGMPSEYRAWTPDGSSPTPPPDKDFESSPTKHMMALLGDSDDEAPHVEAKPASQQAAARGKANAKSVHAAVSPAASHASADKPEPVPAAMSSPAAQAKAELAAPAHKAAAPDATSDATADATADLTADSSADSVESKAEPAAPEAEHTAATTGRSVASEPTVETTAPEVEHTAATADDSAAAEPKAGPVLQKALEPTDSAAAHEVAGAGVQPQAAKETSVGADHGHDAPDKAATQVSFASDDAIEHAFPTSPKHHALESKREGNLPTQYDAWDPSEEKPVVRGETSLEQMVADFRNDDEEEQEQTKPRGSKPSFKKPSPPKVEADTNVVYDDDDLPKHRRRPVFSELQGGWKSFIAKNAASKPHKPKLDPDLVIMNSLYSNDGGLPQQYTAWQPPVPSFLQQPADATVAAAAVLEQFGAALRSDSLRKLARTQPPRAKLAALWQRLQPLTQRQSQAQRWCLYFQQHAQTAEPVRKAVSRAEAAGNALAAATAQRAAMAEEMNARTQLLRTVEQDVHGLKELLNATLGVEEVADALRATLKRRSAVLAAQQQQLAELRKAVRVEEGTLGEKRAAQARTQKGIAAARKKVAGIQLGCDAALRSLQLQEHSGHMEAHAIEVALQVFAGKE